MVRSVSRNAQVRDERYAPAPQVTQDYGRWRNERLYQADVTSVRAVMGTPAQRCWIEREQVVQQERSGPNVGGAVIGAVIGGILGHQVGRNNGGQQVVTQNVQRCTSAPSQTRPDYWDVTYNFRGQEHRVQMNAAPGAQVTVNQNGEPRA